MAPLVPPTPLFPRFAADNSLLLSTEPIFDDVSFDNITVEYTSALTVAPLSSTTKPSDIHIRTNHFPSKDDLYARRVSDARRNSMSRPSSPFLPSSNFASSSRLAHDTSSSSTEEEMSKVHMAWKSKPPGRSVSREEGSRGGMVEAARQESCPQTRIPVKRSGGTALSRYLAKSAVQRSSIPFQPCPSSRFDCDLPEIPRSIAPTASSHGSLDIPFDNPVYVPKDFIQTEPDLSFTVIDAVDVVDPVVEGSSEATSSESDRHDTGSPDLAVKSSTLVPSSLVDQDDGRDRSNSEHSTSGYSHPEETLMENLPSDLPLGPVPGMEKIQSAPRIKRGVRVEDRQDDFSDPRPPTASTSPLNTTIDSIAAAPTKTQSLIKPKASIDSRAPDGFQETRTLKTTGHMMTIPAKEKTQELAKVNARVESRASIPSPTNELYLIDKRDSTPTSRDPKLTPAAPTICAPTPGIPFPTLADWSDSDCDMSTTSQTSDRPRSRAEGLVSFFTDFLRGSSALKTSQRDLSLNADEGVQEPVKARQAVGEPVRPGPTGTVKLVVPVSRSVPGGNGKAPPYFTSLTRPAKPRAPLQPTAAASTNVAPLPPPPRAVKPLLPKARPAASSAFANAALAKLPPPGKGSSSASRPIKIKTPERARDLASRRKMFEGKVKTPPKPLARPTRPIARTVPVTGRTPGKASRQRAAQRDTFDQAVKERNEQRDKQRRELQRVREEEEEAEYQRKRKETVIRAHPVPNMYKKNLAIVE